MLNQIDSSRFQEIRTYCIENNLSFSEHMAEEKKNSEESETNEVNEKTKSEETKESDKLTSNITKLINEFCNSSEETKTTLENIVKEVREGINWEFHFC